MGLSNLDIEKFLVEFEILKNQLIIILGLGGFGEQEIPYADATGRLTSEAAFLYDTTFNRMKVGSINTGGIQSSSALEINSASAMSISAQGNGVGIGDDVTISGDIFGGGSTGALSVAGTLSSGIHTVNGTTSQIGITGDTDIIQLAANKVTINGAINSSTATITASSDNTNVAGINTLFINPAATVVIGGFAGGVDGQVLHVIIVDGDQDVTLENEEATGTQKLAMHESSDETLSSARGGFTFVFNSTTGFWHDCSHAKYV